MGCCDRQQHEKGGFGIPSLAESRRAYRGYFDLAGVVGDYLEWIKNIFYVVVYRFNYNSGKYEYGCFRSPKRGDQQYAALTLDKFAALRSALDDRVFFDRRKTGGFVSSPVLHAVLEYDANNIGLPDSWRRSGKDFNRFMSYLRRHFGKCSIVRCFESHESGYCHIHVVALFHEYMFEGKVMRNKEGKRRFRVVGESWYTLKDGWTWGYTDFELVDSVRGGVYYLAKYLSKSVSVKEAGSKGVKGLAMCWWSRKRSFSISGDFISLYHDVIIPNSNSTQDVRIIEVGVDLLGARMFLKVTRWKLLGFILSDHVIWKKHFVVIDGSCLSDIDDSGRYFEYLEKKRESLDAGLNEKLASFIS